MTARILVAEDNRVVARDLAQQLNAMGHTVVGIVGSGEDAVQQARETHADLVLMDIRLEGSTDGISAAAQIRDECRIPCVFVTAYADEATLRRALRSEPFGYVLKPFDDLQLRTVIEMALAKAATERRLCASERRFVTTLSSIGDLVIATDEQGLIAFMNPPAEALLERTQREAAGSTLEELLMLADEATGDAIDDPAARALLSRTVVTQKDALLRVISSLEEMPVSYSAAPIMGDSGAVTGAVLVFSNQTERRAAAARLGAAQAALARAVKLTTAGELTASIAHEVNQPLAAIVTNAQACLRWLAPPTPDIPEASQAARRIVENGRYAAEVIRSIRALARDTPPRLTPIALSEIVQDVFALARMEAGRTGVTLISMVTVSLPAVLADPVQLRQVMLNLVLNGIEAQAEEQQDGRVQVDASMPTQSIMVVNVADHGPGVDPAMADRLFDPLFTTKADGMGLGLSICRSIIQAHGGQIGYSPRQPLGSVFHFTLQVADEASAVMSPESGF
jgi:signal transduction histidine kinase